MFELSVATFRERWQLFLGAIVTVALGVALVQSSLLILLSALDHVEAITLLAMTLGIAAFLAVFIVSSTFAFTIAQRRRDLALLRLIGSSRGQVRRLLLSEALLLGLIGTALGVPAGVGVMGLQSRMLTGLEFLPAAFSPEWQGWIIVVSAVVGVGVSLFGVLAASRRAAKVRPLEALRESGDAARVMTFPRWFFGILFVAGAVALAIVAVFGGASTAIPLSVNSAVTAAVGLSALSPLLVPLVSRVFGLVPGRGTLGTLARANLADGVRRSASTAAPLLVLVALVAGLAGTLSTLTAAGRQEMVQDLDADLVAASAPARPVPGIAVASTETTVPVVVSFDKSGKRKVKEKQALVVDAGDYRRTHREAPVAGSFADLHGMAVAARGAALGDAITVRIGDREFDTRVVAVLPDSFVGGPGYLLPRDLVPSSLLGNAPAHTIVKLAPGADPAKVAASLPGPVTTVGDWIATGSSKQEKTSSGIMTVLMGLAGLYSVIAVINAVVIAAAERRREFAVVRVTGLKRWQVVLMALVESLAVVVIALLLGLVAASAALAGITGATVRILGTATLSLPWTTLGLVVLGAFTVVGLTSVWTSISATRQAPVGLLGARE
ncbi:ABC transporter permease [Amycolatopsis cynarae]|uniref:ABC transporter permease n=1 Tax=Amycolatopsis cynarae TaxID=2995223 RepID=A0ABY7AVK2_9PSEU|nr:ABC transporter permease [Amycolatopsis sp. HUAS 11-8]WAL64030.1 ABC transporter permease [Amycolatopsis sp. HUAS 11-8]